MKTIIAGSLLLLFFSCSQSKDEKCYDYNLVYLSKASGNYDIYLNDLKGNEQQLTTNPSWDWYPMWNQLLESIIHYAYINDTFQIRRVSLDGSILELDTKELLEFNLSPNASMVVMEENKGDNRQLVIVSLDKMNRVPITDSTSYNGRAKWSPDSRKIAYISGRDGNNEVYLYDLKSKKTKRLTKDSLTQKYLTWSPDNRSIAYTNEYYGEDEDDRNDVFILNLESGISTQITKNEFEDSELDWSPDGKKIAFHSKRNGYDHIYTMNIDGSDVQQISTQDAYHGEPVWVKKEINCQ